MKQEMKNGMNHLDEQTMALYVLQAPEVEPRRAEIAKHLKRCNGCTLLFKEVSAYYAEFRELQQQSLQTLPVVVAPERALRSYAFRQDSSIAAQKGTLPQRFVNSFRQFPVRWSAGFVTVMTALVLLTAKFETRDTNPAYARAKDEFLIAYGSTGEELWRKHIGAGYNVIGRDQGILTTMDVEGDGRNEILAIFGWAGGVPLANSVACFNADGTERWKREIRPHMTFGNKALFDDYLVTSMMVGDFDRDGRNEVITVARNSLYWPSVIDRFDAQNGTLLGEYWHSGWLYSLDHRDIDGDGVEEIFVVGENNSFDLASMVVLDPRRIEGHAPANNEFIPQGVRTGTEKYYVLLPRSDIQKLGSFPRNQASNITFKSDGSIEVAAHDRLAELDYNVFFYFTTTMVCTKAIPSDNFTTFHQRWEAEGKLSKKSPDQISDELRQAVAYWDGEKFVHQPTKNRRYEEIAKKGLSAKDWSNETVR